MTLSRTARLIALVLCSGCGSDDPPTKAIGDSCLVATDCPNPLACAFSRCHAQCLADRDCPDGQHCVGAAAPRTGVCLLKDETECTRHSDCPQPLVCGRRLRCESQCRSDRDCVGTMVCSVGTCTDPVNVPETGADAGGQSNDTCSYTSQCNAPLVCRGGFCQLECIDARDCAQGFACTEGVCRAPVADAGVDGAIDATLDGAGDTAADVPSDGPPGFDAPCTYTSECKGSLVCRSGRCVYECLAAADCAKGWFCYANVCLASPPDGGVATDATVGEAGVSCSSNDDCDDKAWCNGLERCLLGRCAPALERPCDSHSSCVVDTCDETSRTCKHVKTAGTDVDGDGQLDLVCGGTDCDDKDPSTYQGAPERCDGKDNSCNGVVDEYAVALRGSIGTSTPASARIHTLGIGMPAGKLAALSVAAGVCTGSNLSRLYAQIVDKGVAGTEKLLASGSCGGSSILGAAGGDGAFVVGYQPDSSRTLLVVKDDLTVIATHVLNPAGITPTGGDLDIVWTGTRWIAGWTRNVTSSTEGRWGFFHPDGSGEQRALPSGDGSSFVKADALVRVAYNATTIAVAWSDTGGDVQLSILDGTGGKLVGPVKVAAGRVFALTGTSKGYVAFAGVSTSNAIFVSNAGVVGTSVPLSTTLRPGHGAFDAARGEGAAAILGADGVTLYYARQDLSTGVERSLIFAPTTVNPSDLCSLTALGTDLVLGHGAMVDDKARAFRIGCLP